jgi:hypothetical protein
MSYSKSRNSARVLSLHSAEIFAERWHKVESEKQNAQSFWREFFIDVCGVSDLREAEIEFERPVINSKKGTTNSIDVFWKNTVLIEHKSAGKDLDIAEQQARGYIVSLPPALRPPVIIVSDFARIRIIEYLVNESFEFGLKDLPKNLSRIENIIEGHTGAITDVEVEADQKAAKLMADLYLQLENNGFKDHQASVFMVRILFCLFADDTRMWKSDSFKSLIQDTREDGKDVGSRIQSLFEILNLPKELRSNQIDELISDFPYVNGGLFREHIPTIHFNKGMRTALMSACDYDWGCINPTVFGSLFQSIKKKEVRRVLGEHYTTEESINKVLNPILFDELNEKAVLAWDNDVRLRQLQMDLGEIQIFDPACGSGNFLITAYKRLRRLELDIIQRIKQLQGKSGQPGLLDGTKELSVHIGQLHGIEIDEWSFQIANVAIFLTDHQQNLMLETVVGYAPEKFPLTDSAKLVQGNALRIDWKSVCEVSDKTVVVGNPPFGGASWQTDEQKEDQRRLWAGSTKSGDLDYVANWYLLAALYIQETKARVGLVSTNSITQGQAPQTIWTKLFQLNVSIDFAHRTFVWESDVSGKAAVHCVIIGFSLNKKNMTVPLWDYKDGKGKPILVNATNINCYLLDAPNLVITSRTKPLSKFVPEMNKGSAPYDGGFLSKISPEEAVQIRSRDKTAAKYLQRIIGGDEFVNGIERYCLWLVDADPSDLQNSAELKRRLIAVRDNRLASKRKATQKDAQRPSLFHEIRHPKAGFIALPEVSSENRNYIPVGFFDTSIIPTNKIQVIEGGDLPLFSVLCSSVFTSWVRAISGRLESRFSISSEITYNNFPFLEIDSDQKSNLSRHAQAILEAREKYPDASLATLYSALTMPSELLKAHQENNHAVLKIYGLKPTNSESQVLSRLFGEYERLTKISTIFSEEKTGK